MKKINLSFLFILGVILMAHAQIPKPEDVYGFRVGSDYKVADYGQMLTYYEKLASSSDRIQMIEIGKSVMGKPIKLFFISSTENLKSLQQWKETSAKLARARISDNEARKLAKNGKSIIWIDGGMHATEMAHGQMTSELAYRLVSENSDEMNHIRDNVIILLCPEINPDGLNIAVDWYRQNLGTPYETTYPPILYQKYVGHDNNRDWFMANMPETRAASTVLNQEWYPQIVHNHHQTSPAWARIFLPPFRSPVNPKINPGVTTGVNLVGTAMAQRFAMKKMPGVISGTAFSMWWNGGMRTTPYYHNQIGILTETAHRTPSPRFYDPDSIPKRVGGISSNGTEIFYPNPWKGGDSHFRDAVDYMITASMGILAYAADRKQDLLYNMYAMGREEITKSGKDVAFAYIIPPDQWDPGEARNLVNVMLQGGIEVVQATKKFEADGKQYPVGSIIMYGAQPFRPYLEDLMDKQDYPDQFKYPGGPPVPPYDLAGWTLPMQMGVNVIRTITSFKAKTKPLNSITVNSGSVNGDHTFGYLLSNHRNDSYSIVNKLLEAGAAVSIAQTTMQFGKTVFDQGSFIVKSSSVADNIIDGAMKEYGASFHGLETDPQVEVKALGKVKVGIYKSWRANIDEGWTRWVLEEHEFDLDTLHNKDIQSTDLSIYSAIIIPSQRSNTILNGYQQGMMPSQFTGGIGLDGTLKLKEYIEKGGTLITLDAASDYAIEEFGLPVANITAGLSSKQFFIPGSLVRAKVVVDNPLGYGVQPEIAASFSRSRAFKMVVKSQKGEGGLEKTKPAPRPDVTTVVRYAEKDILMSGWAKGQDKYLKGKSAMMDVGLGKGHVILFGFKPQFRGQPRASYKLLFNAIYLKSSN